MDFTVYPQTRIARLPAALRPMALLVRNLSRALPRRHRYSHRSEDLATAHLSPFEHDPAFQAAYERVASHWYQGITDKRWRLWILASLARERVGYPSGSPAAFAEFGVYRGGCSFIVLSTAPLDPAQRYYLFDTFSGIPADRLAEVEQGIAGEFGQTSRVEVARLLAPWKSKIEICEGDVFETLDRVETGDLAFVHMDLNASAPTVRSLEYVYPRLVPGGIIVFDDYGQARYSEQRLAIDRFLENRPASVVALPTGQGVLIRR